MYVYNIQHIYNPIYPKFFALATMFTCCPIKLYPSYVVSIPRPVNILLNLPKDLLDFLGCLVWDLYHCNIQRGEILDLESHPEITSSWAVPNLVLANNSPFHLLIYQHFGNVKVQLLKKHRNMK